MPENIYSFGETEALLETLSASSTVPEISSFEMNSNSNSSSKSSYYSDSPNETNFLQDDWNRFDDTDFTLNKTIDDEFLNEDINNFVSPSSNDENSPPFMDINDLSIKPIKEESDNEIFSNSDKEDLELHKTKSISLSKNKITKPKKDRSSHTVIEKKYRTNINTKITALRNAVPSLRVASGDKETNIDDLDGLTPPSKVNKATIFTKATEYIKHLEVKNDNLFKENQQLKQMLSNYGNQPQPQTPTFNFSQQPPQQSSQQSLSQFQPATDFNGNPLNMVSPQQPSYQVGLPGKVLMGGLTVMAGQSMFNGNSNYDQYGLSAFPILSTPAFNVFVNVVKFSICLTSLVYIFIPNLFNFDLNKEKDEKVNSIEKFQWYELIKKLVFIRTGDLNKLEISEFDANQLISKTLLNPENEPLTILNHIYLLLQLHTYKSNFEISFGKIIISELLLSYSNLFKNIFFINSKLNDIINENLVEISKNQKINELNLRYFFKELNNHKLSNSECFKRLLNLSLNLELDLNCLKGINDKGYEMILKDDLVINDYKSTLISFRANELFGDVLLEYINLTFNDKLIEDLSNEELKELKLEIWNKLNYCEHLSIKNSVIDIRVELFKSICNEKYLDAVLNLINSETEEVVEEQYSDFEDEDEEYEDEEAEEVVSQASSRQVTPQFKKILSQDLFNSLVCATVLKSINSKKEDEVIKLLKHLKFNKSEISILSFISMFKIVEKFPKEWIQENESKEKFKSILNQVTIYLRLWIGDSNNVNCKDLEDEGIEFKREISDKLVEVSKKFNEY